MLLAVMTLASALLLRPLRPPARSLRRSLPLMCDAVVWEPLCGSLVLRPPSSEPPRAVVHFLGGAFVGASPHLTYSRLLSHLAAAGFVVVATPYEMDFDYLKLCDAVLASFDGAQEALCAEYGLKLPVLGVGHSCGALLHVIICSLFLDEREPPDANVLLSFNNKRASDAIPLFGSLVSPAASSLLQLEHAPIFAPWLQALASARVRLDSAAAAAGGGAPLTRDLAALASQLLPMLDQILPVLRQIDGGQTEFQPAPEQTHSAAAQLYKARRTLLLRFDGDSLDDSEVLDALLRRSGDVQMHSLRGTHLTPLAPALPPLQGPGGGRLELQSLENAARQLQQLDGCTAAAMREFTDATELLVAFLGDSVAPAAEPAAVAGPRAADAAEARVA